ncbi:hypothetical protein Q5692_38345 [Microcoleus sp. C2C3]|uniref:hypothetical protein n=1 Tax=unclassified Microcoleus TaxID=2642155 RepID=UPI002FD68838
MTKIEWVNASQTLLKIDNQIINLAALTQIILNEYLDDDEVPHVTFYVSAQ